MAIITLSYDTADKKVSCAVDGAEMEDMCYFSLSRYEEGEAYLEMVMEPKKTNGVTTYTRVVASENAKKYENTEAFSKDKSLVKVAGITNIKDSVAKWLGFNK